MTAAPATPLNAPAMPLTFCGIGLAKVPWKAARVMSVRVSLNIAETKERKKRGTKWVISEDKQHSPRQLFILWRRSKERYFLKAPLTEWNSEVERTILLLSLMAWF